MIFRSATKNILGLLILSAGIFPPATQANTYPETTEDFAKLPPYCTDRHKGKDYASPYKEKFGGACWLHLHHYCLGLHQVNYAMAETNEKARENHIMVALKEGFDYMWTSAGAQCVLMPEIMVNRGKAVVLIKQYGSALESFRKAIDLNPRYIPAYLELASLYTKSGQTDAARTVLEYALNVDPNSKATQRQLERLNGKAAGKSASKK